MAICASLVGAWIGARLSDDIPYSRAMRPIVVPAALAVFAILAFPLYTNSATDARGSVVLSDVQSGPQRTVNATVTLSPRNAADNAKWLTATAWQGGGRLVVDRLQRVSEGVYRTTEPIPVHGSWKALIRLHKGNAITGLPIYAPEDLAIPVAGVAAPRQFERRFQSDHQLLQREAKTREAGITYGAYGTVLTITLLLIAMLAWGFHRVGVTAGGTRDLPPQEPEPEPEPEPQDAELPAWAQRQPEREYSGSTPS
jgi:hypothetical protein